MARNVKKAAQVAGLIQQVRDSRGAVGDQVTALRQRFDIPERIRSTLLDKPGWLAGGAAGVGFLFSRMFSRPRKQKEKDQKPRTLLGVSVGLLLALVKPAVRGLIVSELQRRFKSHSFWGNPTMETHLPLSKHPSRPPK